MMRVIEQKPLCLGSVQAWLNEKDSQLKVASRLFNGGSVSAVIVDPVGFHLPNDWYAHMLRYEPGVGLVKAEPNPAYIFPCECFDCRKAA